MHIPFCVRKCLYCDFNSFCAPETLKDQYVDALIREIRSKEDDLKGRNLVSVYFGGGTPSLMRPEVYERLLTAADRCTRIGDDCEITMEINPKTASFENIRGYVKAGINRFSIGAQSCIDSELEALGRIHRQPDLINTYDMLLRCGVCNISVDIMTSIPHQTIKSLKKTLDTIISLKPQHISAYSLIIEENTPFYDTGTNGLDLPDEDESLYMDRYTIDRLSQAGYKRYEISNYAKDGYECRHNLGYWERRDYIGTGISAASLLCDHRYTNTPDVEEYMKKPGEDRIEDRYLSLNEKMEEFMFLGLRKTAGISLFKFKDHFGKDIRNVYGDIMDRHIREGYAAEDAGFYRLSQRGLEISNMVLADYLL